MIGIDRLRTVAGAWDEWDLGGTLSEIADQIEREMRDERDRWDDDLSEAEVSWNAVAGVCLDMERHCLGHEGMEDSPVARWARKLREALGGDAEADEDREAAEVSARTGGTFAIGSVTLRDDSFALNASWYDRGERVKRPAALAADGEPLEAGQTVWSVNDGREYKVVTVDSPVQFDTTSIKVDDGKAVDGVWIRPDNLTHQRPVLGADGVPIELGDDLYSVESGLKLHVSTIDRVNCKIATSEMFALDRWADPSMFTHTKPEPPESWERIEEDAERIDETRLWGDRTPDARDLVRRCRALAERERGE